MPTPALIIAGIPQTNLTLLHRVGFSCGDPAAFMQLPDGTRVFLVRAIELPRAKKHAQADLIAAPEAYEPQDGFSPDRETGTAQAAAECLRQADVTEVTADRTLPLLFVHTLNQAGITVHYDATLGITERRVKTETQRQHMREAQRVTHKAIRLAARLFAQATITDDRTLHLNDTPLTSRRVRSAISGYLLEQGFTESHSNIVAGLPECADCHHRGADDEPLKADHPIIVDVFPTSQATHYNGDCTRTFVVGTPSDTVQRMYDAVLQAKAAAEDACRPGATGGDVHHATLTTLATHGFGPPDAATLAAGDLTIEPTMPHGTGHGLGLEVHEPILLGKDVDTVILEHEALTIEPGLYGTRDGGVRVEDLVFTRHDQPAEIVGTLPISLDPAAYG